VRINDFGGGCNGGCNWANIPAENIERIEVVRGPQSALYGANAIGAVIQIFTRTNDGVPKFHGLAEGGSFGYAKGAFGGGGKIGNLTVNADLLRIDSNGVVANGDYRNESASLNVAYDIAKNMRFRYTFGADADESGAPGPYGSNPIGAFPGIDTVSRSKDNSYRHGFSFDALWGRVRQHFEGGIYDDIFNFYSPYPPALTTNFRGTFASQTEIPLTAADSLVAGVEYQHESTTNSYITGAIDRNEMGYFLENRYQYNGRFFLNTGIRVEDVRTGPLTDPARAATSVLSPNPKLSTAFLPVAGGSTKLHGSVGTGLRPPDGFELAFTNNPHLLPERTTSFDVGVEQSFWSKRVVLDATYFYNHFHDLIVTLGPTQQGLSVWQSDNLANSRSQGVEFGYALRLTRALHVSGFYTWNPTRVLALNGTGNQAPPNFEVGQSLIRRPENAAAYDITWHRGRITVDTSAVFRGNVLDIEPNYGASGGLFNNPGYTRADLGVEIAMTREVAIYGRLRNFTDDRYEEVYGYPSPRRNFIAGLKFNLQKR